jgi:hypothetical protein
MNSCLFLNSVSSLKIYSVLTDAGEDAKWKINFTVLYKFLIRSADMKVKKHYPTLVPNKHTVL